MLKGVGPASLRLALNVANFANAPIDAIAKQVPRMASATHASLWTDALERAERQVEYAEISSRSEEHTSELQSQSNLVCRLLLEKKKRIFTYRSFKESIHERAIY